MNEIINLPSNPFSCIASRTASLCSARLWSDMCRLCIKCSTISLLFIPDIPFFPLKMNWKGIWHRLGSVHFQGKFTREENSFATQSEGKHLWGESEGGLHGLCVYGITQLLWRRQQKNNNKKQNKKASVIRPQNVCLRADMLKKIFFLWICDRY